MRPAKGKGFFLMVDHDEQVEADVVIEHTHADGTLAFNSPGDGSGDILNANGFHWGPSIECWYIRNSRDRNATDTLHRAAAALKAAGMTVEVDIDNTRRPVAEVEEDLAARAAGRNARYTEKADQHAKRSEALDQRAQEFFGQMPRGQRDLVGHHSYGKIKRRRDRAHAQDEKSRDEARTARHYANKAATTVSHLARRHDPQVVERRVLEYEREIRVIDRDYPEATAEDRAAGEPKSAKAERREYLVEAIEYWRSVLAQLGWRPWGRQHFRPGDIVMVRGLGGYEVARVNAKSLTVVVDPGWDNKVSYTKVTGRRRDGETITAAPAEE